MQDLLNDVPYEPKEIKPGRVYFLDDLDKLKQTGYLLIFPYGTVPEEDYYFVFGLTTQVIRNFLEKFDPSNEDYHGNMVLIGTDSLPITPTEEKVVTRLTI